MSAPGTIEDKKRKISISTTETVALLRLKLAIISLKNSLVHECTLSSSRNPPQQTWGSNA